MNDVNRIFKHIFETVSRERTEALTNELTFSNTHAIHKTNVCIFEQEKMLFFNNYLLCQTDLYLR